MYKIYFTRICDILYRKIPQLFLVMKLTLILLLVGILQVNASSTFAQRVNLNVKDASLKKVLELLTVQTNLEFIYDSELVSSAKKISLSVSNQPIEEVLEKCFKGESLEFSIKNNTIVIFRKEIQLPSVKSSATVIKDISITGTVLDKGGLPLPGVVVTIKGTTKGAVTDINGKYSISVSDNNAVLVFSFISFVKQEVVVGSKTNINVVLEEQTQNLDEIVVVAFGTQKKETLTGAVASIQTKEIKQSPAANLAVTLAGRLPGLTAIQRSGEPGRDLTQLFIRGQGTVNAQAPIVLVDGVERDLTYIDPNEVESVTILKDASSTAIFGVRGANGVILVTTRRGTSEIPEINFSSEFGLQSFTRVADPVNSFDFATLRNLAQVNDGRTPAYSAAALQAYKDGSDRLRFPDTDWNDMLIKNQALQQRYNLNISGAAKAARYFVNAGVLNQGGQFNTIKELGYDPSFNLGRYNFRSNIDLQINKGLKAFLNLAGYLEKQNSPFGVSVASTGQGGQSPSAFILANIYDIPSIVPGPVAPDGTVTTSPTLVNAPYGLLNRSGYRQQTRSNVIATFGMEQQLEMITKGLSARAVISFDSRANNNLNASKTFAKSIQIIDPNVKGADGKDSVSYARFNDDLDNPIVIGAADASFTSFTDFQGFLNYNRTFGKHAVTGLVFLQQQKRIVNNQLPFNLRGISNRLTYGYNGKYFTEFNAGYNGSEQFAKGNRFGFFPAVSGAWIISRENFWKNNLKAIDLFKIRASYGEVGNDRIGNERFLYLDQVSVAGGGYSPSLGLLPGQSVGTTINITQLKNEQLQWEVARKTNIGIEIGFLNSFNLTVDLFNEQRDNILRNRGTIPILNGLPNSVVPPVNIGVINNKGYEADLSYKKSLSKDLSIQSRVNISYATNRQEFADEPLRPVDNAFRYRQTGFRIGQNFGYLVDKYFESEAEILASPTQLVGGRPTLPGDFKYRNLNGDNVIDDRDIAPIGYSAVPEYTYGGALNVSYKSFDVSVLFQGVSNVTNFFANRGTFPGQNYFARHLNSWTAEKVANGEPIDYPRLTTDPSPNEIRNSFFVIDASYLRLKNVEVGYTLPTKFTAKFGSKQVRLYANGLNLHTWDNLPTNEFDPELNDELAYPVVRVINFGLNVTF